MSRLGPTQQLVLLALERRKPGILPPTPDDVAVAVNVLASVAAPELVDRIAHSPCTAAAAHGALERLADRGLVAKLDVAFPRVRWAITDAGRAALTEVSS